MSDDVLVRVENVSKRFCRSLKRSLWYGLQDLGSELGGRRHGGGSGLPQSSADVELRKDEFWAVKDVSFELRRGECLGLIGRNGAGKTTLLRILNGLIKPDTGCVYIKGNVGGVIALGSGFNPVLSGMENILIQASLYGISSQQLGRAIEDIVDFAELADFIDSPVQSYSSGMVTRLGFSIAAVMSPDVVLIDEVLAVGDENFQLKCLNRISELRNEGKALILVSHQAIHIERMCNSCLLLRPNRTFQQFDNAQLAIKEMRSNTNFDQRNKNSSYAVHYPSSSFTVLEVIGVDFVDDRIAVNLELQDSKPLNIYLSYALYSASTEVRSGTTKSAMPLVINCGKQTLEIKLPDAAWLIPQFTISLSLWSSDDNNALVWVNNLSPRTTQTSINIIKARAIKA